METAQDRPRFRNDLVAQPIEEEGVRYVDVTDPNSGSTFRFYDVEYSIACAMDGARDVDTLAEWTRAELGIEASHDELLSVINTLAELGYLEGRDGVTAAAAEGGDAVPESVDSATATEAQPSSYTDEATQLGAAVPGEPAEAGDAAASADAEPAAEAEPPGEAEAPELALEPEVQDDEAEISARAVTEPPLDVEDIELGPPGGPPPAVDEAGIEDATPKAVDEAEVSFAGILDEEEATPPPPAPVQRASRSSEPAHHLDDEDPTQVPAAHIEDDDDDVSVDLSAHLALDKNEVAEAVRSSRVHSIPEIPKELTLEITDEDKVEETPPAPAAAPTPPPPPPAPEPVRARAITPLPPSAPRLVPADDERPVREESRPRTSPSIDEARVPPAVALPSRPPTPLTASSSGVRSANRTSRPIEPTKMPPPATQQKAPPTRNALGGALIVVAMLVAAAALYFFRDQIFGSGDHSSSSRPQETPTPTAPRPANPTPDQPPAMRPPNPPPQPTAVVRSEEAAAAATDAKSPSAGTVAWTVADGSAVEQGAVLAKLFGFAKYEQSIKEATARGEVYAKKLAEAQAKNDAAAIDAATKKVDEKKQLVTDGEKELERYLIKAPVAGTVKLSVAQGGSVKPEDVVAQIAGAGAPTLKATFDAGAAAGGYKAGANCVVAAKIAPDKQFPCVVDSVDGGKVDVHLVTAGSLGITAGDEVVLRSPSN